MSGTRPWQKWREIMPAVRLARISLGLNKSRLDLLEKLLACLPGELIEPDTRGELIVHVSNARLAEMTNRDGDKTITRLITELERRRLIERKSSPNGKRYARQGPDGSRLAFGLDLAPLLARMPEIDAEAKRVADKAEALRRERVACSLLLMRLSEGPDGNSPLSDADQTLLEEGRRILRRKPLHESLASLKARLEDRIGKSARKALQTVPSAEVQPSDARVSTEAESETGSSQRRSEPGTTMKLRGIAPQNACHKEPRQIHSEKQASISDNDFRRDPARGSRLGKYRTKVVLTPEIVERAMPRVAGLGRSLQGSLRDLVDRIILALGVSGRLWGEAMNRFGFEEGAMLLMFIYERQRVIENAPAYLTRILQREPRSGIPGSRAVAGLLS